MTTTCRMTEADLLAAVRECAGYLGWLCYHTHDSRHSEPGFPDLVLVHPGQRRMLFCELKSDKGQLGDDQKRWLDALKAAGQRWYVWRPENWMAGEIERVLRSHAQEG